MDKFVCSCGCDTTEESIDAWIDENNLITNAFCKKCNKHYTKYFKLESYEEV